MKEAWKALLRAIRDILRWALRIVVIPVIGALDGLGSASNRMADELRKI